MKFSYNWLQNYFEEKLPEAEKISEGLTFHSFEVEDIENIDGDKVFNIDILPNRAHDCLSHWGVAKEIAMIFDLEIKKYNYKIFEPTQTELDIRIEDDKCLRYMGRIIRDIEVKESPDWLKTRLRSIGQKSINNVVDAANFVMFDLGQPIHCFDLDKLESPQIIIRNGKIGEKLTTLDKKEVDLDESILVIADEKNPLALAGIKGGIKAEVDEKTKNIIIEVADFNYISTRKTSKRINILTDAVKRYENEISPELCGFAMPAITDLIYNLAGGKVEEVVDVYKDKVVEKTISITNNYINKKLGSDFSENEISSVWDKLNFSYDKKGDEFIVKIPALRVDLSYYYDLVEEVIRVLGYDKLKETLPEIKLDPKFNETFNKMLIARSILLNEGYGEVMTYVFRDKGDIRVLAAASNKNFLRNNLKDGLEESFKLNKLNAPLLELDEIKIFEIGTVFKKEGEEIHIAYVENKNIREMTLNEFIIEKKISTSNNGIKNLDFPNENIQPFFKPWSVYPFITRDIACWVPENVSPEKLSEIYSDLGTELLVREPKLFDQFKKDNKVSYAFRLVFQSEDRTLTDEEVNDIMTNIEEKILSLGFVVR